MTKFKIGDKVVWKKSAFAPQVRTVEYIDEVDGKIEYSGRFWKTTEDNLILASDLQLLLEHENGHVINSKHRQILEVCKGNEDFMWAAKIISIILDCDFREAKQALERVNSVN